MVVVKWLKVKDSGVFPVLFGAPPGPGELSGPPRMALTFLHRRIILWMKGRFRIAGDCSVSILACESLRSLTSLFIGTFDYRYGFANRNVYATFCPNIT